MTRQWDVPLIIHRAHERGYPYAFAVKRCTGNKAGEATEDAARLAFFAAVTEGGMFDSSRITAFAYHKVAIDTAYRCGKLL